MARRIAAIALLLAARAALAQLTPSTGLTVTETNDQDQRISIAECDGTRSDNLIFNWTYTGWSFAGTYRLTLSDQSGCPSSAHTQVYDNLDGSASTGAYPTSGQPAVVVSQLLANLGISCSGAATALYVCVDFLPGSGSGGAIVPGAVTGTLALDLTRPPAPVVGVPTPGDTNLNVSWSAGSGSSYYDVVATSQANPADQHRTTVTGTTSARIGGLTNGVAYDVVVYAFSAGGNQSDVSNTVTGTPVQVEDFWRLYRAAGGREAGCATGGAGAVSLLVLVPLALRRRRRP